MDGYFNKLLHLFAIKAGCIQKKTCIAAGILFGWMMGLEPTTLRITI